jgi:hypothetical protein
MVAVRSVRAFFNLQVGVTRSESAPPPPWLSRGGENGGVLEGARRLLRSGSRELKGSRVAPADRDAGAEAHRDGAAELSDDAANELGAQKSLRSDQLIWMFGHSRTGSTWLSWMMAELENQERWHEPYVGMLFGNFLYQRLKDNPVVLNSPHFILTDRYREVWLRSVRNLVLEGGAARFPELREDQYLAIKEPNGSIAAPLLMEATPGSRMIFLIRDPRDVIASRLDAFKEGGWAVQDRDLSTPEKVKEQTERLAKDYLRVVSMVQEAFDARSGKKALVRYEDLRHDTVNVLRAMYDALEVEADQAQIEAAAAKHSWEQIPESEKGKDKFFRKAQPGGWRDDLSGDQIKIIEEITGPLISRYY